MKGKLTPKQESFCQNYAISGNATDAAKKAGYSENTAASIGAENLTKPQIQARLAEIRGKVAKRVRKSQDVLLEYLEDALDINPLEWLEINKKGELVVKKGKQLPEELGRFISKMYATAHGVRVEFFSKEKAVEMLGRAQGMFTDNVNVTGISDLLEMVRKRKAQRAQDGQTTITKKEQ